MKFNNYIFFIVVFIGLIACNKNVQSNNSASEDVAAKINTSELTKEELLSRMPKALSGEDSIVFKTNLINHWASDEVFYQQAIKYLSEDEITIDKEVEAYKHELIAFKFQQKLIAEKLDTLITDAQIETYYNANAESFMLKSNIVKVLYIKTPITIPNIEKFKKLCYSSNPKDLAQLNDLCIQYANNFYMNDNTWLLFDDLKKEMYQLNETPEYSIQAGKTFEFTDERNFYFLKIIDVKSKNTQSPLNFEKANIRNMIFNQRKQQLISNIKKDFFDKALTNKELIINN